MGKQVGRGADATSCVIAANPSQDLAGEPMGLGKVSFTLDALPIAKGATAVALDEDAAGHFQPGSRRTVALQPSGKGCSLVDDFGALAAHIYRIGASTPDAR